MDEVKLKPVFITDETGRPVAVQVDIESFQHVLELLAALLRNGRIPPGLPADDPLLKQLSGLLEGQGDYDDPLERLEDLVDSVAFLRAKADAADYIDYEDVRAELLELDKQ